MLGEGRGNVGSQGGVGAREHALDEVDEPDDQVGEGQGGGRPCYGDGLDFLDAGLGMGVHDGVVASRAGV